MALNDYSPNRYLPETLRVWLNQPNKVYSLVEINYLRIFSGYDLMAVLNNKFASNLASGYTEANRSNLMSGIAPRLLQILVNKVVNKVDYIGYKNCEEIEKVVSKDYLTLKLKKSFNNAIRTGRDLLVLYVPKDGSKGIKIQNVDCFRHIVTFDDEKINDVLILLNQQEMRANCYYNIFEHRFYKDGKPYMEYVLNRMEWNNDKLDETEKVIISKEETEKLVKTIKNNSEFSFLKEYKFYNPVELPFDDLGCYHVDNTFDNAKFPNTTIPESRFVNIQDKVMEIENSLTYKEVDKNIGRGRAVIPSAFNFTQGLTKAGGNSTNLANRGAFNNPLDSTYFIQYNTNAMDKAIAPQGIQFDIRSDAWRTALNGEIGDLCAAFGISILDYDPRLLQTGQRTDDEINAMTDITASTVEELRSMNEYQINLMLNSIAKFLDYKTPLEIKWSVAAIINPMKNQELISKQLTDGTISRKEAIKRSNPDFTSDEVEEQLKIIQEERGLAEANSIF